jgi:hypothetical protein
MCPIPASSALLGAGMIDAPRQVESEAIAQALTP